MTTGDERTAVHWWVGHFHKFLCSGVVWPISLIIIISMTVAVGGGGGRGQGAATPNRFGEPPGACKIFLSSTGSTRGD